MDGGDGVGHWVDQRVGNHWVGHQGADRVDWDQGVGWVGHWDHFGVWGWLVGGSWVGHALVLHVGHVAAVAHGVSVVGHNLWVVQSLLTIPLFR